jgi:hypothetical protein
VTAEALIVDETVSAVPAVVPVKVAEYVPLLLSLTAVSDPALVPPDVLKATVKPPES